MESPEDKIPGKWKYMYKENPQWGVVVQFRMPKREAYRYKYKLPPQLSHLGKRERKEKEQRKLFHITGDL